MNNNMNSRMVFLAENYEELRIKVRNKVYDINTMLDKEKDTIQTGRLEIKFLMSEIAQGVGEETEEFYKILFTHLDRIIEILKKIDKWYDPYELDMLLKGFRCYRIDNNQLEIGSYSKI